MLFENNTDNVQNGYRSMIWPSVCKCVLECVHLHIKKRIQIETYHVFVFTPRIQPKNYSISSNYFTKVCLMASIVWLAHTNSCSSQAIINKHTLKY